MDVDEKLIYLVQKHDCLYNPTAKSYNDRNSKNNAWGKVCEDINLTASECQYRWKRLRECYRKALKLRQSNSKGSARLKKRIKFEEELEFLKPYLNQSQASNLDSSEPEEIITDEFQIHSESSSQSLASLRPGTQEYEEQLQPQIVYKHYEDPTDSFFLTMSRKIKKMPKKIQAEIERDVFRLVNEAEIKLAEDNIPSSSGTQQYTPSEYSTRSPTEGLLHLPSNTFVIHSSSDERSSTPAQSGTYIPAIALKEEIME